MVEPLSSLSGRGSCIVELSIAGFEMADMSGNSLTTSDLTLEEVSIQTANGKVFGMASGMPDSKLVLAIHGRSQRNGWHTWQPLLAPLGQAGLYAVSVDLPGWGQSESWANGSISIAEGATVVATIVEGLGKNSAALMGKSWGGGIALQAALDAPHLVEKLILTAPLYLDIGNLAGLSQPVLMAWSEDDPTIPYMFSAEFTKVIPEITLLTYNSGGHNAAPKNAVDFAPKAITFLRS
jgi:pimeloyl-ACP methyl ester carboxylesterase